MALTWAVVSNIPAWIDPIQLLGVGEWVPQGLPALDAQTPTEQGVSSSGLTYEARIPRVQAGLLLARLRGLHIDGQQISCRLSPPLKRSQIRQGSLEDSRLRRHNSAGFSHLGVRLDRVGKYSLTPESIALEIGFSLDKASVIDACCGAGGNSIGFARSGCQVTAFEIDPMRIKDASHNAKIYQCAHRIDFIQGDFIRYLTQQRDLNHVNADTILWIDPPWEDYSRGSSDLSNFPFLQMVLNHVNDGRFAEIMIKLPAGFRTSSLKNFRPRAVFGDQPGDRHRIKFLLLCQSNPLSFKSQKNTAQDST